MLIDNYFTTDLSVFKYLTDNLGQGEKFRLVTGYYN